MIRSKGHPCQVRDDEPDKPDKPGKGNDEADQQGNKDQAYFLRLFNIHTKLKGNLFPGGDEVQFFAKLKRMREAAIRAGVRRTKGA